MNTSTKPSAPRRDGFVNVEEGSEGTLLHTDHESSKKTIYHPAHRMWVYIDSLEILSSLGEGDEADPESRVRHRVTGTALLGNRFISVIGDPASASRKLSVYIDDLLDLEAIKRVAVSDSPTPKAWLPSDLGEATVGFNRGDWEIGDIDSWWVSCHVPALFLSTLIDDVRSGRVNGMRIGLSLQRLYSENQSWAPISVMASDPLFLRPDMRNKSLKLPDTAFGSISVIDYTSSRTAVKVESRVRNAFREDDDTEDAIRSSAAPAGAPADGVERLHATSLVAVADSLKRLRSTMNWIGGIIAAALVIIALK